MNEKQIARIIIKAFKRGNKLLIVGNGGSCCQASHMATELVGKYKHNRKPLPAIALTDPAVITAVGNDIGFEEVFARQVRAFGEKGDILLEISTSGLSANVIKAGSWAKVHGMEVVVLPRKGQDTPEIQENHLKMIHKICELVEEAFI